MTRGSGCRREALSRLKTLGLVETRQGAGAFVRPTPDPLVPAPDASLATVLQMVELRRALKTEAFALAAARRSPQDLNAAQTESVLFGARGAAAAPKPESVVVMCSTVEPGVSIALDKHLADQSLLFGARR